LKIPANSDIKSKVKTNHKITYNPKREILQSNILMISKDKDISLATMYKQSIQKDFINDIT